MDVDTVVEMLKNNRTLWVTATATGGFAIIVSILNAIWSLFQYRKQLVNDKNLETYKSELNIEFEHFITGLQKNRYVSKVRFDTEFSLYKDLWGACRKMVNDVYFVYPTYANYPANKEARKEYEDKVYEDAHESYKCFNEMLGNNAPFISREIFSKFVEIKKLCYENILVYEERWNKGNLFIWEGSREQKEAEREAYSRTRDFNSKYELLIDEIRCYLDKLDVGEQEDTPNA